MGILLILHHVFSHFLSLSIIFFFIQYDWRQFQRKLDEIILLVVYCKVRSQNQNPIRVRNGCLFNNIKAHNEEKWHKVAKQGCKTLGSKHFDPRLCRSKGKPDKERLYWVRNQEYLESV